MTAKPKEESVEKIFSSSLVSPALFFLGYGIFLKYQETLWWGVQQISTEPFTHVSWELPIAFIVMYLIMVFGGKKLMENREEFAIKPFIFAYNSYQCIFNLICVIATVHEIGTNPIYTGIWGNYPNKTPASFRISFLVWLHYNNKYIELFDTLFMVLRKKNRQISFLHCYHHVLLIWAWFLVCKIDTTGDVYFGATVNAFVHVVMYGYYTMALLGIKCPWKKYITQMQMLQFCLCFSHSCYAYWKGNAPVILSFAQGFVMVNMLVLFRQFFINSYVKPKAEIAAAKKD